MREDEGVEVVRHGKHQVEIGLMCPSA
jgi:hypothetical protein